MTDSITCPICQVTSYHPVDVAEGYCANCRAFTRQDKAPPTVPELLKFEATAPMLYGAKALTVADRFGISIGLYYLHLAAAARTREGLELNPILCRRITTAIDRRRARRLGK